MRDAHDSLSDKLPTAWLLAGPRGNATAIGSVRAGVSILLMPEFYVKTIILEQLSLMVTSPLLGLSTTLIDPF